VSIQVLIADDQTVVRAGLRMILETDRDVHVVAEAGDGATAVLAARQHRPDLVLMDIQMPGMNGLEATRQIVSFDDPPRVLMLTTFDLDEYVFDALVAGASGFLLKDVTPEPLLAGVKTVAEGESLLAPRVTRRLIDSFVSDHPKTSVSTTGLDGLTARELEILRLMAGFPTSRSPSSSLSPPRP
jgi:DNA-binding NarL/FixJ family response regulator